MSGPERHPANGIPAFDERQLRDALAQFATGVTVVCARGADQRYVGFTANSFKPPFPAFQAREQSCDGPFCFTEYRS